MPQVLQWIKNPVTADKYREVDPAKGCKAPTDMWFASGSFCKKIQCVNGEPGRQCFVPLKTVCLEQESHRFMFGWPSCHSDDSALAGQSKKPLTAAAVLAC